MSALIKFLCLYIIIALPVASPVSESISAFDFNHTFDFNGVLEQEHCNTCNSENSTQNSEKSSKAIAKTIETKEVARYLKAKSIISSVKDFVSVASNPVLHVFDKTKPLEQNMSINTSVSDNVIHDMSFTDDDKKAKITEIKSDYIKLMSRMSMILSDETVLASIAISHEALVANANRWLIDTCIENGLGADTIALIKNSVLKKS